MKNQLTTTRERGVCPRQAAALGAWVLLDAYRHSIALEPAAFLDDVRSVFPDDL